MIAMKKIVLSCKSITEDIESHETKHTPDLSRGKTDLSVALTQLMSTAKAHATEPNWDSRKNISIATTVLSQTVARLVNAITTVEDIVVEDDAINHTDDIMEEYVSHDTYSPLPETQSTKPKNAQQLKVTF